MEDLVLISIKTKYVNQIFSGIKKYEYRRKSIGNKNINKKVFVYSSEIDKAIVGYIVIEEIIEGNMDYVLDVTDNKNNEEIINYFNNCDKCYAYKISKFVKLDKPILSAPSSAIL